MKMRRLANIFHIEVAAIHSMVILHGEQEWNDRTPPPFCSGCRTC